MPVRSGKRCSVRQYSSSIFNGLTGMTSDTTNAWPPPPPLLFLLLQPCGRSLKHLRYHPTQTRYILPDPTAPPPRYVNIFLILTSFPFLHTRPVIFSNTNSLSQLSLTPREANLFCRDLLNLKILAFNWPWSHFHSLSIVQSICLKRSSLLS